MTKYGFTAKSKPVKVEKTVQAEEKKEPEKAEKKKGKKAEND